MNKIGKSTIMIPVPGKMAPSPHHGQLSKKYIVGQFSSLSMYLVLVGLCHVGICHVL